MPRQKALIGILGLAVMFLGACTTQTSAPVPPPAPIPVATSPYDGRWTGEGATPDGRAVSLSFTVQSGAISSFSYTYLALNGKTCTGIDHLQIPAEQQPRISNAGF